MITQQGMVGVSCINLIKRIKKENYGQIFCANISEQEDKSDKLNLFFLMLGFKLL